MLHFQHHVLRASQKRDVFVSVDARHHTSCQVTVMNSESFQCWRKRYKNTSGRRAESVESLNSDQLCEWTEQEAECYTIKELLRKIIGTAGCLTPYKTEWLIEKLAEKYDEHEVRQLY